MLFLILTNFLRLTLHDVRSHNKKLLPSYLLLPQGFGQTGSDGVRRFVVSIAGCLEILCRGVVPTPGVGKAHLTDCRLEFPAPPCEYYLAGVVLVWSVETEFSAPEKLIELMLVLGYLLGINGTRIGATTVKEANKKSN